MLRFCPCFQTKEEEHSKFGGISVELATTQRPRKVVTGNTRGRLRRRVMACSRRKSRKSRLLGVQFVGQPGFSDAESVEEVGGSEM